MVVIFAYHSVNKSDYRYAIAPKLFERHLGFIKSKYKIIDLPELAKILENNELPKRDMAVITFDDGFQDNHTHAFPVLKKMEVPATIFLATGLVGNSVKTSSGEAPMLNWQEIAEMQASGLVDFQSHTNSHIDMFASEPTIIREELEKSKKLLNEKLNKTVDFFAYPKGRMNEKIKSIVAEYFSLAFVGNGIITSTSKLDKLALPRITICNNWGIGKLKLLTSSLYWRLKSLKKKLLRR